MKNFPIFSRDSRDGSLPVPHITCSEDQSHYIYQLSRHIQTQPGSAVITIPSAIETGLDGPIAQMTMQVLVTNIYTRDLEDHFLTLVLQIKAKVGVGRRQEGL